MTMFHFVLDPLADGTFAIEFRGRYIPFVVTRGDAFGFAGRWVFVEFGAAELPERFRINYRHAFESVAQAADHAVESYLIGMIVKSFARPDTSEPTSARRPSRSSWPMSTFLGHPLPLDVLVPDGHV